MTAPAPGWYPDPTGTQGLLRYWDGTQWTQHTTPIPTEAAPTQQPGQHAPQWSPSAAGATGSSSSGNAKNLGLIIGAAVLALALIGTGGFFGIRALMGNDDSTSSSSSDSTSKSAPDPTDAPSPNVDPTATAVAGDPIAPKDTQSCAGGTPTRDAIPLGPDKLRTPDLSASRPPGWSDGSWTNHYYDYLDAVAVATKQVDVGSVATMVVATVPDSWATRYHDPKLIADEILACTATSPRIFHNPNAIIAPTNLRQPANLKGTVVSGHVTEFKPTGPLMNSVTVAVIEVAPKKYATFISSVPLAESPLLLLVKETVEGLTSL